MKIRQIQLFHIYSELWYYSLNCPIIIFFFLKFKELHVNHYYNRKIVFCNKDYQNKIVE